MGRKVLIASGVVIIVLALAGLGAYFGVVGLDRANKLAPVVGVFVALIGVGVSWYGTTRRSGSSATPRQAAVTPQQETVETTVTARDKAVTYTVGKGNIHQTLGPDPRHSNDCGHGGPHPDGKTDA